MTDLERIRAKFAAEYGLSEDMLRNAERWTETTGDLEGVPENLLPGILGMRFGAIAIDTPRSERWSTPEDIDVIADLAYLAGWRVRYGRGSVPRPFARPVSAA